MVRYYGYYANRTRGARSKTALEIAPAVEDTPAERIRRRSWARLLEGVFEVDPLVCSQCQVEMEFVAVIRGRCLFPGLVDLMNPAAVISRR